MQWQWLVEQHLCWTWYLTTQSKQWAVLRHLCPLGTSWTLQCLCPRSASLSRRHTGHLHTTFWKKQRAHAPRLAFIELQGFDHPRWSWAWRVDSGLLKPPRRGARQDVETEWFQMNYTSIRPLISMRSYSTPNLQLRSLSVLFVPTHLPPWHIADNNHNTQPWHQATSLNYSQCSTQINIQPWLPYEN